MCYSALVKRDLDYLERNFGAVAVREQIDEYELASTRDPKHYPPLADRIYPGHYAPVIYMHDGIRQIELMRYGAYPQATVPTPKRYTTFNARRDNLTSSFWSEAFMQHHGFVVLGGFFEWVAVKDLIRAAHVGLEAVDKYFAQQTAMRKEKVLASGKKYRLTPTETKPALERKIVITFAPQTETDLLVPIIFSKAPGTRQGPQNGFAIVTDEPPPDISRAGHDRCPIILNPEAIGQWIHTLGKNAQEVTAALDNKQSLRFVHDLAEP